MTIPDQIRNTLRDMLDQLDIVTDESTRWQERAFEGTSFDGEVRAMTTGAGSLESVSISRHAIRTLDNLSLGDAVVEAVNAAEEQARAAHSALLDGFRINGTTLSDFLTDPAIATSTSLAEEGNR